MAGIFHPSRGGTRGGQDQFNWEDIKTDKDREFYLGHSLKASVGRWQEGKDLFWYTRDQDNDDEKNEKRKKEIASVKDLEARAMAAALGHKSSGSAATSITAKELQEVLSRDQAGSSEMKMKQTLVEEWKEANEKEGEEGSKRTKSKKKKKRKKRSSESGTSEDEKEKEVDHHRKRNLEKRRRRRSCDEVSENDSDTSKGRYNNERSERYRKSTNERTRNEIGTRNTRFNEDDSDNENSCARSSSNSKGERARKRPNSGRYDSSDEEENIRERRRSDRKEPSTKATYNQPEDSRVKFVPKGKRQRHDSSDDD